MHNKRIFSFYKNCSFCNSKNLKKIKRPIVNENFYTKAILSDLFISKSKINKLNILECQRCHLIQVNPWFNKNITRKIYSNIYGQHNKSWSNYLSFVNHGKMPNHGKLFELLTNNIQVKNYAEYNSPFMGLFFNFFKKEYKEDKYFYKKISKKLIEYLSSRQLAGKSQIYIKNSQTKTEKLVRQIKSSKKKNFIKNKINKYLFVDNSEMCWGQNDNYKSVNSRSLASELFDLEIINITTKNKIKLDLFGIFLTLDHTFEPRKILDYALSNSKFVIIQCHTTKEVTRQHQFSFTKKFLNFLKLINIHHIDLTKMISKNSSLNELYFICSRNRSLIKKLNSNILKFF